MSYAVKGVTTERGLDAGNFAMVAYGGAGPLHASAIAREIGIRRVLIPFSPGHFSAYGMLFSDLRHDYVRSCFRRLADAPFEELEAHLCARWKRRAARAVEQSAVRPERDRHRARGRHALCRPGARGHGRAADRRCSQRRTATAIKQRFRRSAPAALRHLGAEANRPRSSACASTVIGVMREAAARRSRRGAATPPADGALRGEATVYFRDAAASSTTPVYRARRAARRQSHRGPGADRGARLDHRARAGRRADGRRIRQSRSSRSGATGMTTSQRRQQIDPVTVEIVRNGLLAVTEEMKTNLMRTAYNMIIYEALDFTVGLFTRERRHDLDRPRPADVHPRHGARR